MSSASRNHKRIATYCELDKAAKALRSFGKDAASAGRRAVSAAEALEALKVALKHVKDAGRMAEATHQEWQEDGKPKAKTHRDALPAPLRRKLAKAAAGLEALATEVKGLPVTPEQKVLAKVARAKARDVKKEGGRVGAKR